MSFSLAHQGKKNKTADRKMSTLAKPYHQHSNSASDSHDSAIIRLQRAIGNQAVQRLMLSNALGETDFAKVETFQPKMKVSQPRDEYEQEADRVAEQVMRILVYSDATALMPTT